MCEQTATMRDRNWDLKLMTRQNQDLGNTPLDTASRDRWNICWQSRNLVACASIIVAMFATIVSVQNSRTTTADEMVIAEETEKLEQLFTDYLAFNETEMRLATPVRLSTEIDDLEPLDPALLKVAAIRGSEQQCLAEAIYYEARNEAAIGRVAVADVILNRVKSSVYPDTICGVVYQGSKRVTGCQFSFTCDGSMDKALEHKHWSKAENMATAILAGVHLPVSRKATHYHANYVDPYWAPNLEPTATIGVHHFYKFPSKAFLAAAGQ